MESAMNSNESHMRNENTSSPFHPDVKEEPTFESVDIDNHSYIYSSPGAMCR